MPLDPNKRFWRGPEERDATPEFQAARADEFAATPEEMESILTRPAGESADDVTDDVTDGATDRDTDRGTDRRAFLKAAGFTLGGTLAACSRGAQEKLIPLLAKPEGIAAGHALWYATTCGGCSTGCGLLVKSRDGRPLKIEGNPEHPLSRGGVCPVGQASLLGVYDSERLAAPLASGRALDWKRIDEEVLVRLEQVRKGVVFLTGTVTSPSTRARIAEFLTRFPDTEHLTYDAVSPSAILSAHERTFGQRVLPHYRFDRADLVVSFDADFLGTWVSPIEFTKAWTSRRAPEQAAAGYGRHVQIEGRLSLTGSNADQRFPLAPSQAARALDRLAAALALKAGATKPDFGLGGAAAPAAGDLPAETLAALADALWQARGVSLCIAGADDVRQQCAVNFVNQVLGNYGKTLDVEHPSTQHAGDGKALARLVARMQAGKIDALVFAGCNPVYSLPEPGFAAALAHVPLKIAFAERTDETTALCDYVLPVPHFLSTWNDAELVGGVLGLAQPLMAPLEQSRSLRETLAHWAGDHRSDLDLLRAYWEEKVFPRQKEVPTFQAFWDRSVHDGFARVPAPAQVPGAWREPKLADLPPADAAGAGKELVLYEKLAMRDGAHAYNAWLHELPDPVTKAVWDNYVCLAPATAKELGVENGDVLRVTAGGAAVELPALLQPGQHRDVVAIAVGYGRKGTDRFARVGPQWLFGKPTVDDGATVGGNAFPLARLTSEGVRLDNRVQVQRTGRKVDVALTQTHHTMKEPDELGGRTRDHVREALLADYRRDPAASNPKAEPLGQLWPDDHQATGHQWGLAIDLNRCTGCSACVVACQIENNVPVVGKDEVLRRREMHWIRIDRYYSGEDEQVDVVHQPVMCQHCENAPCETVCPALATNHSREGLNQQVYNRCVGTRYCENNCPYKVRRFNWFDYRPTGQRENLALNPDVTTRARGVMEKCSMCVQRIQESKAEVRRRGRELADGDIQTACQQSCPADAIVFGDRSDPHSRLSALKSGPRHYHVLEELNTRPAVGYLTKIRNRES